MSSYLRYFATRVQAVHQLPHRQRPKPDSVARGILATTLAPPPLACAQLPWEEAVLAPEKMQRRGGAELGDVGG